MQAHRPSPVPYSRHALLTWRWLFVALLLVVLWPPLAMAESMDTEEANADLEGGIELADGPPRVEATHPRVKLILRSDRAELVPGEQVRVGLTFEIEPGWQTYWKFAGPGNPASLPTYVKVKAPKGFEASPVAFPVPKRYDKPVPGHDPLTFFAYIDEAFFDSTVRVPEDAAVGTNVDLKVNSRWQVCNEAQCLAGNSALTLTLPVVASDQATPPPADWAAPFDKHAKKKPLAVWPEGYTLTSTLSHSPIRPNDPFAVVLKVTPPEDVTLSVPDGKYHLPAFTRAVEGSLPEGLPRARVADDGALVIAVPLKASILHDDLADEIITADELKDKTLSVEGLVQIEATSADGAAKVLTLPYAVSVAVAPPGTPASVGDKALLAHVDMDALGLTVPAGVAGADVAAEVQDPAQTAAAEAAASLPLWQILLLALLGGLILNVMPCVLPVLSLKSLALVELANETSGGVRMHAAAYAGGVIASFWVLAGFIIALKVSGEFVGFGFQFQSPEFVIGMIALIFLSSLSLFNVFHIPGLSMSPGGHEGEGSGLMTSFNQGILATLLSTPCSAPFLGSALAASLSQPAEIILLTFTVIGLGLALPVVVLALFPAARALIPRPGMWMEHFKQGVGFLLLGTIVWLFHTLSALISLDALTGVLAFMVALAFAAWLYGRFADGFAPLRKKLLFIAIGTLISGATAYQFINLSTDLEASPGQVKASERIAWQGLNREQTLALAAKGQTVFIDFTANWCANCKVVEKTVIETDVIGDAIREYGISAVKVDWTRRDPAIGEWVKSYGRAGIPLYVVLPAGQPNNPIILPELPGQGDILSAFKRAGASKKKLEDDGEKICDNSTGSC